MWCGASEAETGGNATSPRWEQRARACGSPASRSARGHSGGRFLDAHVRRDEPIHRREPGLRGAGECRTREVDEQGEDQRVNPTLELQFYHG